MRCGAVRCSMVQCDEVWCSVVQFGAVCCSDATRRGLKSQCVAVWSSTVWCGAVWCSVVQCGAVWCTVVRCVAALQNEEGSNRAMHKAC